MSVISPKLFDKSTQPASSTLWERSPFFSAITPDDGIFERFGICDACPVSTRRGPVPICDVQPDDELITRQDGYVSPIGILATAAADHPHSILVEAGAIGPNHPADSIIMGVQNKISRYISTPVSRQPSSVTLDAGDLLDDHARSGRTADRLCVPVFQYCVEIQIQSIYVFCPGIWDLTAMRSRREQML